MSDVDTKLAETADAEDIAAVEAQLAGMSKHAAEQVERHLDEMPASVTIEEVQHEIDRANAAAEAVREAQELRHEQVQEILQGDLSRAHDLAGEREYQVQIAEDQGDSVDHPLIEARADVAALSWAAHEQSIADDHAASAAAYDAVGDHEHAEQYGDMADDHAESASDHADTATHDDASDSGSDVDTTQTDG
ncbi:MAG: hypothetical protein IBJ03_18375 [Gemmatimonadaceae bacterium]|nr:hypothetical protein [Gemmatimonadaceae bacterium]